MKINTTSILAAAGLLSLSAIQVHASPIKASPVNAEASLPYPILPMTYVGPIKLGGKDVTLNGTVQEIYSQIKDLTGSVLKPEDSHDHHSDRKLQTRSKISINCNPQGEHAKMRAIRDGIKYLKGLRGMCSTPGLNCYRVSCSYGSGIFICNDTSHTVEVSCRDLASYAQDIVDMCAGEYVGTAKGQEFDSAGFNVIVKKGNC